MVDADEFGRDPSVQGMRRVFAAAEAAQGRLLQELNISRFDKRLRQWRKMTLHVFEQNWARAARYGTTLTEKDLGDLYVHCLAKVMETKGTVVPERALPGNRAVESLLEEKK